MHFKIPAGLAMLAAGTVICQYILMIQNRVVDSLETTIRFFSFFTILTNILVAIFFARLTFRLQQHSSPGLNAYRGMTATTLYIGIVGLVYQFLLRHLWNPKGAQWITDELLHTVIPAMTLVFWCTHRKNEPLAFRQIYLWMIYPLVYLSYVLIRGHFSGFYPYPFLYVHDLGMTKVLLNALLLLMIFASLATLMIWLQHRSENQKPSSI